MTAIAAIVFGIVFLLLVSGVAYRALLRLFRS